MRYIITGATSFLGLKLIEHLLSKGDEVVCICRSNSQKSFLLPKKARVIYLNMNEYWRITSLIPRADVFINLAWDGTDHSGRDDVLIQESNIKYSLDALFAASTIGCKLFVESGSQAEYGIQASPQTESQVCHPISEYGKAKLNLLFKATEFCKSRSLKYLHLRIFSLFGENDHPWTLIISSLQKMISGEAIPLTSCQQNWNYLYINDAVDKIDAIIQYALYEKSFQQEVYNLASRDTRPLAEFIQSMKSITKTKSHLCFDSIPDRPVVSLQPDMSKLESVIGKRDEAQFETIIGCIIDRYHEF